MARLPAMLLLLPLAACGGRRGGGGPGEEDAPLATGLDIARITFNQAVEVGFAEDGNLLNPSSRNADLIAERPALVRVYVEPQDAWDGRAVNAVLKVGDARYEHELELDEASEAASLDSTFHFEVDAEDMTEDATVSVELQEVGSGSHDGDDARARFPEDGSSPLDARDVGVVRIRLVPIRYRADGSNRLPDTSEAQVEHLREAMWKHYPAAEVVMTVDDPLDINYQVSPFGAGWVELLDQVAYLRDQRGVGDDEYLYGLFNAMSSFEQWCGGGGCIMGLSSLSQSPGYALARASIGVGFTGDYASDTMVHEVGHAHGREHAPCGLGGQPSDPQYPYSGARTGVWGWDLADGSLKRPDTHTDVMSYCDPTWMSDYTYQALAERVEAVNALALWRGADAPRPRILARVTEDGRIVNARRLERAKPADATHRIELLGDDGAKLADAGAVFTPFDHLPGGLISFEDPGDDVAAVRLGDAVLSLR